MEADEAKARIEKLRAETTLLTATAKRTEEMHLASLEKTRKESALVDLQIQQDAREVEAAAVASRKLSARYWFIPTSAHVFQSSAAGIVLAGALLFLYEPLIQTVREVTEKESKLASLDAQIQAKENELLKRSNQEVALRLGREREKLKAENENFKSELEKLIADSKSVEAQQKKAAEEANKFKRDFEKLKREYTFLAEEAASNRDEKARYEALAKEADKRTIELSEKSRTLEQTAQKGAKRSEQLQETLDTRAIKGVKVGIYSTAGNAQTAKSLISMLSRIGANVVKKDLDLTVSETNESFGSNDIIGRNESDIEAVRQIQKFVKKTVVLNQKTDVISLHDVVVRLYK